MKHLLPAALLALLPSVVLALEFTDTSNTYADAPFSLAEAAGISVLTHIGAVEGNPDGTFAAERTINRAEFLKIVFRSNGRISADSSDADTCFPDVTQSDWFSPYVCLAYERGDVKGYPDGTFKPGQPVNYAEALKMLSMIFGYDVEEEAGAQWYKAYADEARSRGTALPGAVAYDALLTRGQMARLAAAYVAEAEGELSLYRQFEKGKTPTLSSSSAASSSSSSSSSVSSISSVSSASSVSSSSRPSAFSPAISRFLVAGTTTPVLLDGIFTSAEEDGVIHQVELELRREIKSLDALVLVDTTGKEIATLQLQTYSNTSKTKWRADTMTEAYTLPKDAPVRLGFKAKMKPLGSGGVSNELFELKTMALRVTGITSNNSRQIVPTDTHYPYHQTSYGRIASVRDALGSALTVPQGAARTIGSFTVAGQAASGGALTVESLAFVLQATDVSLSNIRIGTTNSVQQGDCATERVSDQTVVTCFVHESMRSLSGGPVTMSIYADLSVAAAKQSGTVHLASLGTGGIGSNGMVRWSDQSTAFNWIDGDAILESGPVVTVTK